MATAKQKANWARFARMARRKAKALKKKRSPKIRRVKVTARRRRVARRAPRRYFRKSKKGFSISLLSIAQYTILYSILSKQELGTVLQALINSLVSGDDSFLDIVIGQVNAMITTITTEPLKVALQGAVVVTVFAALKSAVGSRKLIGVGKYSIRV